MPNNINSILKEVLKNIEPSKEETKIIDDKLKIFLKKLNSEIKKQELKTEVFVGGSSAKKTLIKKEKYDIDIFLRFNKQYRNEDLSDITENLLGNLGEMKRVHGSRDYFQIQINNWLFFEIVPVKKISKPEQSLNITDLSYSHVKYISKKIKSKKILDDIKLAKAFCHAQKCYGAESYIHGFSGYCLELLIIYYGSFQKFIKEISKLNLKEKIIIDLEKHYKNKREIMMELNTSKLLSPIILIDPTFKERNAAAGLSLEALKKFQESCKNFIKSPSIKHFDKALIDFNKLKDNAKKKKLNFIKIELSTEKQAGDIAGSKLRKFAHHLEPEIAKYFDIKEKEFEYHQQQTAITFISAKPKKEITLTGPQITDEKHAKAFKLKHKNTFEKKGQLYSKQKINFTLKEFLKNWLDKNQDKVKDMDIEDIKVT